MGSSDITALFLTANRVPAQWADYHMRVLRDAIGEIPMITISREQMPITTLLDDSELSYSNIYKQMLRGARLVTTPYLAIVEDDCLYSADHFTCFRPKNDEFAYNRNRWSIFTWWRPMYSLKERISNCSLIAPTRLMIESLEERYAKNPDGGNVVGELGKERTEKHLGVTIRKRVDFYSDVPIVHFNHDFAHDGTQVRHTKRHGDIRALEIEHWGRAEELVKHFK